MSKKILPVQNQYIKPQWKVWPSFSIMLLVISLGYILGHFYDSVQRPGGFMLLANVLQFACFFLIPLHVATVLHRQPPAAMGIPSRPLAAGVGLAVRWGLLLYALNVMFSLLQLMIFPDQPQEMQTIMEAMLEGNSLLELWGLVFCVTVLAPVGEEIFFRSFFFGALEARYGRLAGVLISAAVFASVHESIWNFLPMFVGGCGFALLYARYRDITLNIVAHSVWNSISVMLMFAIYK